jgi:predicted ATPase
MLESLREYAAERLGDGAERAALAAAHAAHFAGFVEGVAARLRTAERPALLRALDAEHENVRAALAWCAGAGGDAATGLRLAGAAWRYWSARFHHTEGRAVLAAALAAPGADVPELASARAQALVGAATLAREQGDHAAASALADEALGIWRALGDPLQEAVTLGVRGAAVATASDYAGAETAYDAAERLLRALPADPARDAALSSLLNNAGAMAMERGDFPRARTLLTEGLSLARTSGDAESECRALYNLGATLTSLDDETDDAAHQSLLAEAEGHFDACLARAHEMEDGRMVAFALYGVGDIYFMRNETGRAEAAYAESAALFQRGGDRRLQAAVLRSQVYLALHHGDAARAARPAAEAIRVLLLQGDRRQLASALDLAACVPAMAGRHAEAARLWGAAEAIRTALGVRTRSVPDSPNAVQSAAARTALGDAAYDAAFAEGEAMPAEDAAALALSLLGA